MIRLLRWSALAACLTLSLSASAQVPWAVETTYAPGGSLGPLALTGGPEGRLWATSPLTNGVSVYRPDGGLEALVGAARGNFAALDARGGRAFSSAGAVFLAGAAQAGGTVPLFSVRDGGQVDDALGAPLSVPFVARVALANLADGGLQLLAATTTGLVTRFALADDGAGHLVPSAGDAFGLGEAPSALVVDDLTRTAFAILPSRGVVAHALDRDGGVELVGALDGGPAWGGLPTGLAVTHTPGGDTVLLVAVPSLSQVVSLVWSNGVLVVLGRASFALDGGARPVLFSDQLAVTTQALEGFPVGALALADHGNGGLGANVKLVDWAQAARPLGVALGPVTTPDGGAVDAGHGGSITEGGGGGGVAPSGEPVEPRPCGCSAGSAPVSLSFVVVCALFFSRRRHTEGCP